MFEPYFGVGAVSHSLMGVSFNGRQFLVIWCKMFMLATVDVPEHQ